ncbi:PREDICTED: protein CBFA2T3-like, partial [Propithecus coquereli]|uniref:protein CBFA2T3-like n=1 Tax=Propithecus coquereli TaxID=379532 RepID=UPI00063F9CE3
MAAAPTTALVGRERLLLAVQPQQLGEECASFACQPRRAGPDIWPFPALLGPRKPWTAALGSAAKRKPEFYSLRRAEDRPSAGPAAGQDGRDLAGRGQVGLGLLSALSRSRGWSKSGPRCVRRQERARPSSYSQDGAVAARTRHSAVLRVLAVQVLCLPTLAVVRLPRPTHCIPLSRERWTGCSRSGPAETSRVCFREAENRYREDGPAPALPHGRFHGCLKWSMVCLLMNGSGHSPTAVSGAPSTPSGFSDGPASSCTAALSTQHLPPACGARQLSKLKRFLTTLQQFGSDISPEIGERVRTLVLGLVNSTLTIEEFHSKLQEATNFPLRPFVIPFLKANLPLLQRELLHCARLAKQTPAQYLAQHEQLLLDASACSPTDSSDLLLDVNENGKRRTPDRTKENGSDRDPLLPEHLSKRPCTLSPAQRYSPSNGLPHPTPPPHYRLEDMAVAHHFRDPYRPPDPRELRERHRHL